MIRSSCPRCRSLLESPTRLAEQKITCPHCGQRLQLPPPATLNKTVLATPAYQSEEEKRLEESAPSVRLLKCLGKAIVHNAPRAVVNAIPFGGVLYDIADQTVRDYQGLTPVVPTPVSEEADPCAGPRRDEPEAGGGWHERDRVGAGHGPPGGERDWPTDTTSGATPNRLRVALLGLAFVGAVALLGLVVGVIVLVTNNGAGDSRLGVASAREPKKEPIPAPARDPRKEPLPASARDSKKEPPPAPVKPTDAIGEIRRFEGHSQGVVDVAFAPDGRTAVSGGEDKTLRLWDVASGKEIRRFEGHTDRIVGVCFTPDGLRFVSGGGDKTIRLWDVESGKEIRRFAHTDLPHYGLWVNPDGKKLFSSSDDKVGHVWDLESGKEIRTFGYRGTLDRNKVNVWIVSFSADGRHALTGSTDDIVRLCDVERGAVLREVDRPSRAATFSGDGRFILACGTDNYLRLYDVGSGKLIRRFQEESAGFRPAPSGASFSPDGQRVLTPCDRQDDAVLWDVQSGKALFRIAGHPGGISRIIFSPDGKRALSAGRDGSVRLWGLPD